MELASRLDEAAARLSRRSSVRVVAHHDADGIAAAAILFQALARRGASVQITATSRVSPELRADLAGEEAVVFCDLGSQAASGADGRAEVIHLDHHPLAAGLPGLVVNPWLDGLDGTEAVSSAGLAYLLARRLGPCGDLAGVALAGTLSDRQPVAGLNREILDDGIRAGSVRVERGPRIPGDARTPVRDALLHLAEPWTDIAGDPGAVGRFLETLSLDGSLGLRELAPDSTEALGRGLDGLRRSAEPAPLMGEVYTLPRGAVGEALLLGTVLNCAGYSGEPSVGIALACGDGRLRERGLDLWRKFQGRLIGALRTLRPEESRLLRVVRAPERSLGGALASVAARCFPADRPLLVLHEGPGGVKVSARALRPLRERGVDLGEALGRAASRLGGAGGGHPVAAGATLPAGTAGEFLASVEEMVGGQLGGGT
ncbi:MAG: DHH family phosphoesterase [Halobacteria archaeon]